MMDKDAWDVKKGLEGYERLHFNSRKPWHNESANPDVSIVYKDIEGQITNRDITINQITADILTAEDEFWIHAYCHLRKQNREFRLSRIQKLIIFDTGEIVRRDDYEEFFLNIYKKSPGNTHKKIIDKFSNELKILNYIADLDDRFTSKEKKIIYDFINNKCDLKIKEDEKLFIDEYIGKNLSSQTKALRAASNLKNSESYDEEMLVKAINDIASLVKKENLVVEAGIKMVFDKLKKN